MKQVQNIYLGEYSNPVEEYVMLSDGGSVNKYSELSLYGRQCINNQSTYRQGSVQATDTWGIHYKQFDKKIVGFKLVGAATGNSYDSFNFQMSPSANFSGGNIPSFINALEFGANSTIYGGSSTGGVGGGERVNSSYTSFFQQNKNNSTTRVTFEGTLENGVWNINVTTAAGQSWTATKTPDSANTDLYVVGFSAGRRYTGQAGNFYEVIIYLQGN